MFNQLVKIYPSTIRYNPLDNNTNDYVWFISEEKEILGIHQNELTEKDISLLSTFLKRYNHLLPEKTADEKFWHQLIEEKENYTHVKPFRFVYFSMQPDQIDPITFSEAIKELFGRYIPILWRSETTGILIEAISLTDEQINYEQIIDILMADLSVHIRFFIGDTRQNQIRMDQYYDSIIQGGITTFQVTKKEVISYTESIPYIVLHHIDRSTKDQLVQSILKDFYEDEEMLKTLEMFFSCNLNVSETAKKMYMHRNSLQYRIDKFINETGVNIQRFDEALAVKLALLANKKI
ncbi:helix-turn-helix domain-containing protein [Pseudogracilibacillus sp. SE30717A]|uniref:PucR family transcriptional regulator n=1 Tax=Pseudogracilibacillus sp. SE30717A TaxID=3098293 RepID=UPI00300DDA73